MNLIDDMEAFMRAFKERVDSRPTIPIPPVDTTVKITTTVHFPAGPKKPEPFQPAKLFDVYCGCGDPTTEFRSRAGSLAKCGFVGFVDTTKRYLTKVTTLDASSDDSWDREPPEEGEDGCHLGYTIEYSETSTQSYDEETCVAGSAVCVGSGSFNFEYTPALCNGTSSSGSLDCSSTLPKGVFFNVLASDFGACTTSANPGVTTTVTPTQTVRTTDQSLIFGCSGSNYTTSISRTRTTVETLSSEYTTAQLKTNTTDWTEDDYTEWGEGATSSFADLSVNELNYSAQEAQVRINHTGSCYLKVWLRTVFTPEDDPEDLEYADLAVYEYTSAAEGSHQSPAYTISVPSENGTKSVQMKFICTEGAPEPAWP